MFFGSGKMRKDFRQLTGSTRCLSLRDYNVVRSVCGQIAGELTETSALMPAPLGAKLSALKAQDQDVSSAVTSSPGRSSLPYVACCRVTCIPVRS